MIGAVVVFGICVGTLSAFEVLAVLKKIDFAITGHATRDGQ